MFRNIQERICVICDNPYMPKTPRQRCCGKACSRINHNNHTNAVYHAHKAAVMGIRAFNADRNGAAPALSGKSKKPARTWHNERLRPAAARMCDGRGEYECKCPLCERRHMVALRSRPTVMPRIYCDGCRNMAHSRAMDLDAATPYQIGCR